MTYMEYVLSNFWDFLQENSIDIYNETTLKMELGIYLRRNLGDEFIFEFDKNVSCFEINLNTNRKIDIVIAAPQLEDYKCAIEIYYSKKGKYKDQMYSLLQDIEFLEQLAEKGFDEAYAVTVVDEHLFYEGKKQDGIYSYFRGNNVTPISGKIYYTSPTIKQPPLCIKGSYTIRWKDMSNNKKQYVLSIKSDDIKTEKSCQRGCNIQENLNEIYKLYIDQLTLNESSPAYKWNKKLRKLMITKLDPDNLSPDGKICDTKAVSELADKIVLRLNLIMPDNIEIIKGYIKKDGYIEKNSIFSIYNNYNIRLFLCLMKHLTYEGKITKKGKIEATVNKTKQDVKWDLINKKTRKYILNLLCILSYYFPDTWVLSDDDLDNIGKKMQL